MALLVVRSQSVHRAETINFYYKFIIKILLKNAAICGNETVEQQIG